MGNTSKKARKEQRCKMYPLTQKKDHQKGVFSHGLSRAAPDITDKIEQI